MLERIKKLQSILEREQIDGMLVCRDSDVRYLSGEKFEPGSTILAIGRDAGFVITDGRFENQLKNRKDGLTPVIYDPAGGLYGEAGALLKKRGISRVSVQYSSLSHAAFRTLSDLGIEAADCAPFLDEMRMKKDAGELELIRRACAVSDASFEEVLGGLHPGLSEIEVSGMLEYAFKKRGGDGLAFDTIVASGPVNGANCHAAVTARKLEKGDSVTMDFGTTYEGYCSDITRTVFLGKASDEQKKIYGIVREAKKRAASLLREGARLREIAAAGVGHITDSGYMVPHGIGHSFGYDAHEPLFISIRDGRMLRAGMVTTLEPGIYVPGVGGVRLEDDYLITPSGAEKLTHCTDELLEL
jgi:Xaa-Pro aminopeptidase